MSQIKTLDVAALRGDLAQIGLNLCSTFAVADLADSVPDLALSAFSHLLLIGSAGSDLWAEMPAHYLRKVHPVDQYSVDRINQYLKNVLAEDEWQILFPDNPSDADAPQNSPPAKTTGLIQHVPLQKLGALAGWHQPSPLGIGINSTHGLWFAYRAVVAISADVRVVDSLAGVDQVELTSDSPCLSCEMTPCLSHCPADALALGQSPNLNACVNFRVADDSDCASACLARLACPVGSAFRYTNDQTAYFYNRSLAAAVRWIK